MTNTTNNSSYIEDENILKEADEMNKSFDEAKKDTKESLEGLINKINVKGASFDKLVNKIPELQKMVGYDQKSDFHSLTLDEHTKKLEETLENDEFVKNHPKKDLIILAGILHDTGKTSEKGHQVHPKDPNKNQYIGHEIESENLNREILKKFDISQNDIDFVSKITGLHASALNMIDSIGGKLFKKNGNNFMLDENLNLISNSGKIELKGSDLKAFDKFLSEVEKIPGDNIEDKMKIVLALNKADKSGGFNEKSDLMDPKVQSIIKKSTEQIKVLLELEKALPELLKAVEGKRNGKQTAGIKLENGIYEAINI